MDRPDVQGRVAILKVHARGKALGKDVDLEKVARRTPGFTGGSQMPTADPWYCPCSLGVMLQHTDSWLMLPGGFVAFYAV